MKNRYLTKQQKNDIAISILYDWALEGRKEYPSVLTVSSRLSADFLSKFNIPDIYRLLIRLRTMMDEIEYICVVNL